MLAGTRSVGDSLVIVRHTRSVGTWGMVVEPLGVLRIDSVSPTVLTARVVRQFGDARVGDKVIALGAAPVIGVGQPRPVEGGAQGFVPVHQLLQAALQHVRVQVA